MKRILASVVAIAWAALSPALPPLASQVPQPQPLTLPLQCAGRDCPLLQGAPQTAGMRSGFVRLNPGETVGWHTTGQNEEVLVVLAGQGEARLEGYLTRPFTAPALVYVPPATRHNVTNMGETPLEYVYVVAPAKPQQPARQRQPRPIGHRD